MEPVRVPLKFCGVQPGFGEFPSFVLWTLLESVGFPPGAKMMALPAKSTVSDITMREVGIFVPDSSGFTKGQIYRP